MKIELITFGRELLDGRRVDTNSAWLGRQFISMGFAPQYHQTVDDTVEDSMAAIRLALSRSDWIIATGGLGPTADDLTFEALGRALEQNLTFRPEVFEQIQARFLERGRVCPDSNRRQACLPEKGEVLANPLGTAPGCRVEVDGRRIFCLPGVPSEMIYLFSRYVVPEFRQQMGDARKWVERSYQFLGIGESQLEEWIERSDVRSVQGGEVEIAYTSHFPHVDVTLRLAPEREEDTTAMCEEADRRLRADLGEYLMAVDDQTLEARVVDVFRQRNLRLAVAESMTGGLITSQLVNVPGASAVLERSYVTYSNLSKIEQLGVSQETLRIMGAASKACALEMARGARIVSGADVGIASTGIAGPTGERPGKPVGLTYLAWAGPGVEEVREYQFRWERNRNRMLAAFEALRGAIRLVESHHFIGKK